MRCFRMAWVFVTVHAPVEQQVCCIHKRRSKRKEPCLLNLFHPAKWWCSSTVEWGGCGRFWGRGKAPRVSGLLGAGSSGERCLPSEVLVPSRWLLASSSYSPFGVICECFIRFYMGETTLSSWSNHTFGPWLPKFLSSDLDSRRRNQIMALSFCIVGRQDIITLHLPFRDHTYGP